VIPFGVTLPDVVAPFPPPPPKLCFIKAHRRKYGPEVLLRALKLVKKEIPDIKLTMAGEGEMTAELKHLTGELGLDENVDFVGFIPNDRIYSLLKGHHIMVMPSVMDSESFGVAVLEASACARPVIASRVGGVPEVLDDGNTGLLVPPGNVEALAAAIVGLARDSERCLKIGEAGRELVRNRYLWEHSLDQMARLYEKMIDVR
jgi:glycosyltransferase involved in cell wall biosynthesis